MHKKSAIVCTVLFLLTGQAVSEDKPIAYKINELPKTFRLFAPRYLVENQAEFVVWIPAGKAEDEYTLKIEGPGKQVRSVPLETGKSQEGPWAPEGIAQAIVSIDTSKWDDATCSVSLLRGSDDSAETLLEDEFHIRRQWVERHVDKADRAEFGLWLEHVNRPREIWKKVPNWNNVDAVMDKPDLLWDGLTGLVLRSYENPQLKRRQPYTVYVPETYDAKKQAPLLILLHGSGGNYVNIISDMVEGQELESQPMLIANAGAYRYQEYRHMALLDVKWVIEDMKSKYNVDPRRVYVQGISLGGRGCLELAALMPGTFAAVSPQGVYGMFQEASDPAAFAAQPEYTRHQLARWDIRSLLPSLHDVPTQIIFGRKDRTTPALNALAFKHMLRYRYGNEECHAVGFDADHNISYPVYKWSDTRKWMLSHKRSDKPARQVFFRTPALRYNRKDWVTIGSFQQYFKPAGVLARHVGQQNLLAVRTENTDRLTLNPPGQVSRILCDSDSITGNWPAGSDITLVRGESGKWALAPDAPGDEAKPSTDEKSPLRKVPGQAGPIWDICCEENILVVYGTQGSEAENKGLRKLAESVGSLDTAWGDGRLPMVADSDLTGEQRKTHSLILIGDARTNKIIADAPADHWPFDLKAVGQGKSVSLPGGAKALGNNGEVLTFLYPSPFGKKHANYAMIVAPADATAEPHRSLRPADTWTGAVWADWCVLRHSKVRFGGKERWRQQVLADGVFDENWQPVKREGKTLVRPRYMNWERD
ncbi:MAG: hypothetical protein ACLFVU_08035 [Phycisphaerae bacterium]